MASYLLLRNNKESGPYSLEALIQLGLKPYDLVWIQGRSAAWRYPSEVDDLKFYAPVVEEQPYDRFYKKPSEEKKEIQEPVVQVKKPVIAETVQQEITEINKHEEKIEVNIPRKQVFISMPANTGRTVFIKKTEEVKATPVAASVNDSFNSNQDSFKKAEPVSFIGSASPSYSDLVNDYNSYHTPEKKIPVNEKATAYNESSLETKYTQSLDDIKDIYVQTLADRKKRTAQRKKTMVIVRKVVPFAAVLIAGFVLGIFMMNSRTGTVPQSQTAIIPKTEAAVTKPDVNAANNNSQVVQQPVTQTPEQSKEIKPAENPVTDNTKTVTAEKELVSDKQNITAVPAVTTKKNLPKENKTTAPATNNASVLTQPKNVEVDQATGERNKVVRSLETDNTNSSTTVPVRVPATAWKQVSVKSNEYKRGTFGGIHDLQLTVTNNSNYLLDNVLVELQYLKPTGEPLKTDNIRFSPVPPNGSLTLAMAPTTRGVKVAYKIIHVESKAAGNDTAGL